MIGVRDGGDPLVAGLVTVFMRLFESEFVTLEGFGISCRAPDGMRYLDENGALALLLADAVGEPGPGDPSRSALHAAMYAAWPEVGAIVSGPSRHLRALMAEGCAMPEPTGMMRKRGVTRLADHVVEAGALDGASRDTALAAAHEQAQAKGMNHVLVIEPDGTVHVAGMAQAETTAHYSNVEFSARVECMRIEERIAQALHA